MSRRASVVLLLLIWTSFVRGDFPCLCCYSLETAVYQEKALNAGTLGYMYEFDCKPLYDNLTIPDNLWTAIQFEHKIGYVPMIQDQVIQQCPGSIPPGDQVAETSSATTSTTHLSSTESPTTHSPSTGPQTTSPLTAQPTLPQPSTAQSIKTQPPTQHYITTQTNSCPQNVVTHASDHQGYFMSRGDSRFEFVNHTKTWNNAEGSCRHRGGHLTSIMNQAEENALLVFMYDIGVKNETWIGLTDQHHEHRFIWSSESNPSWHLIG